MRYELSTLRRKARMEKKAMMAEKQLQQQQLLLQNPSGNVVVSERSASASSAAPALTAIPAAASLVQLVHIVMPPHANHMNTMFGGILMEWAEEASRLSVHRLMHAMTHGAPAQNLKSLVKKFEHLGAGASAASPAAKRWFHLSTVCAKHRKFRICSLSHDTPRSHVDGISFLTPLAAMWTAYPSLRPLRFSPHGDQNRDSSIVCVFADRVHPQVGDRVQMTAQVCRCHNVT